MALREPVEAAFDPILDDIARLLGRYGMSEGKAEGANAALRVTLEEYVRRVVQVYWTPFEASIPQSCIGLHLEVAEPRVHWAEAYLSHNYRSWFFAFQERADGDIQLAYHQDYYRPEDALPRFFDLAHWYVLIPAGVSWKDVVYEVDPRLGWSEHRKGLAGEFTSAAVQESLKKSTIIWLRWRTPAGNKQTMPVWFLYDNKSGKIYVLSGERQQTIPGAENLREVEVILRWKGKNARVAEIPAHVRVIEHGPEWNEVAEKIAEKRLNIPGLPEETAKRWRDECVILELTLRA